jgi:cytochrome P450
MALRAVQRLCIKIDASIAAGTSINMSEEFRVLTLQVIAEAVLSLSPEESDQTFAHMYLPIVEEGNLRTWHPERTFMPFLPAFWKYHASVKKLNGYVSDLINARRALRRSEALEAEGGGSILRKQDLLDKVLQASPCDADWTDEALQQVCDEVKTFILAGHETSASMLTWALYELSQNSTLRDKLRHQADDVYGPAQPPGDRASIPPKDTLTAKLDYADCCLRESLRKYSVVPTVVRVCSEPLVFEERNIHIPRGTNVMINIQGAHWNEENWPEPATYRPERFYEPIKPYTFLPFVEGPRMCLGQFLSLLESKIVLSLLVQSYDFEVVNTEDAGKTHPFMVPIIPKTGHIMRVSKRF